MSLKTRVDKLSKRSDDNPFRSFVRNIVSLPLPRTNNGDTVERKPIEKIEWKEFCRNIENFAKKGTWS